MLHVTFLLDVIISCAILPNILMQQLPKKVEELLKILCIVRLEGTLVDEDGRVVDASEVIEDSFATAQGSGKRLDIGVYFTMRRRP